MKIQIHTSDLNAVLKDATRAAETKGAVPWMSGVLLEASGNKLCATCTNGTQTIARTVECSVRNEGRVLLDGRLLLNVASKLPGGSCTIDATDGKKAVIKAEGSKTNMALMDAAAFTKPASVTQTFAFRTDAQKLFAALRNVLYAVPAADTRATLTGVSVQSKNGVLHLCGMDGYRMGIAKVPAEVEGSEFAIIVPRKTIADMTGVFAEEEGVLEVTCDGRHMSIASAETALHSQLIAGEYVNYKQVITNTKPTCKVMFSVHQLKAALNRAMVMCEGKNNLLKMLIQDDGVTVSGMGDVGDATETVECSVSGPGLEIGFNGRLLLDAVSAVCEDEAVFQFSSSVGPAMLTSANGGGWMHVVLPVRVQ